MASKQAATSRSCSDLRVVSSPWQDAELAAHVEEGTRAAQLRAVAQEAAASRDAAQVRIFVSLLPAPSPAYLDCQPHRRHTQASRRQCFLNESPLGMSRHDVTARRGLPTFAFCWKKPCDLCHRRGRRRCWRRGTGRGGSWTASAWRGLTSARPSSLQQPCWRCTCSIVCRFCC